VLKAIHLRTLYLPAIY